jgi:hypothetical protein
VILDGKIVDTDRCREKTISRKGNVIDVWYSGKRHDFGGNIQSVMRPDGLPIWVGPVEPRVGARPDVRAGSPPSARCMPQPLRACRPWPTPATTAPASGSMSRSSSPPMGAGSAWTTARIGEIVKAALVLTQFEHGYLPR